jgi:hypothetical protein
VISDKGCLATWKHQAADSPPTKWTLVLRPLYQICAAASTNFDKQLTEKRYECADWVQMAQDKMLQ